MKLLSKLLPASNLKLVISIIGIIALVAYSSVILFETTKAQVFITENGEKQAVKTHADTVDELLSEAGITFNEHDYLSHDLDTKIEAEMNITYKNANKVTVVTDGKEQVYFTTVDTVGEFLKEKSLAVSDRDEMSHDGTDPIKQGIELTIDKAYKVLINDGGEKKEVWTTGGTVKKLLQEYKISLGKLDEIKPAKKVEVEKDTRITIVRVEKVTDVVEEKIDYKIEKREDGNLEKGKKRVISKGEEGLLVKKYEVVKENGKEVSRKLISEKTEQESEPRVVAFGTKESQPVVALSSRSNDDSGKVLYMSASAYTAGCSGCSGITSTGINLNNNPNMKVVAVDPGVIPLGSKVWVEGYGYAIAGDTGGHIVGNRIDLHFPTRSSALSFGRRTVKVKVLD